MCIVLNFLGLLNSLLLFYSLLSLLLILFCSFQTVRKICSSYFFAFSHKTNFGLRFYFLNYAPLYKYYFSDEVMPGYFHSCTCKLWILGTSFWSPTHLESLALFFEDTVLNFLVWWATLVHSLFKLFVSKLKRTLLMEPRLSLKIIHLFLFFISFYLVGFQPMKMPVLLFYGCFSLLESILSFFQAHFSI